MENGRRMSSQTPKAMEDTYKVLESVVGLTKSLQPLVLDILIGLILALQIFSFLYHGPDRALSVYSNVRRESHTRGGYEQVGSSA